MSAIQDVFTSHKWRPLILAFGGILAGALIVGLIWGVAAIRTTQVANTKITKDTNSATKAAEETLEIVKDCVSQTGKCYERNQQATGNVVGSLTAGALYASSFSAACADKPGVQGADEIYKCTKRLIRKAVKEGDQ